MSSMMWVQLTVFLGVLIVAGPPLGRIIAAIATGDRSSLLRWLGPIEGLVYRLTGVDAGREMTWWQYCRTILVANVVGVVVLVLQQQVQQWLPLNPDHAGRVPFLLSLNTAVSFVTNTNWQAYAGETTLSHLTQMIGLGVQNFLSAAAGMAVLFALARGIVRTETDKVGNAWADMTRSTIYILLPLSIVVSILLLGQGVIQNFDATTPIVSAGSTEQMVPMGPVASQVAIKQLGSNGGGFFNANSAHPLENPTPFSNLVEMLSLLLIPVALVFAYGRMVNDRRHGRILVASLMALFVAFIGISMWAEFSSNGAVGMTTAMEGKEVRFGITNSILWSNATTASSNGSVNAMHSSLSPIAGGLAMINMMLGEVVFGGVGSGMYGLIVFILLTVFLAGLMVGRTPEYHGKQIGSFEIRMSMVAVLLPSTCIMVGAGMALATEAGRASMLHGGAHGVSEVLYAMASAAGNNGSAFAGLDASKDFYTIVTSICMLVGRYGVIIPVLAIAGRMASKRKVPMGPGTFPTDTPIFGLLLLVVLLIIGALTFFPVLSLGPIAEHLIMSAGGVQ